MHGDGVVGMLFVVGVNIAVFTTLFVLSELAVHLIWPTAKRNGKSEFGENGAVANAGTSSITFPLCLPISVICGDVHYNAFGHELIARDLIADYEKRQVRERNDTSFVHIRQAQ